MMNDEKPVPVLFLDIDGTVREGKDDPLGKFVNGPEDVRVFPEAVERMEAWKASGGRIAGISNQGGIGLGIVAEAAVKAAMRETQRQTGDLFDVIEWCPHAPDAGCWCRKPLPGLIYEAVGNLEADWVTAARDRCLFVGDRPEDQECARAAGVPFQWAHDWRAGA